MILADISSFLGTIWFCVICACAGYIAGHVVPFNKLIGLFTKK